MRRLLLKGHISRTHIAQLLVTVSLLAVGLLHFSNAYGAELPQRSLLLSDSTASATANYVLSFTLPAPENLGSIQLQICSNSPLLTDVCNPPAGFNISGASLTGQNGETGFSIYAPGTNANTIVLTRPASLAAAVPVSYSFGSVVNPSSVGTFYGRLQTFATSDASGPANDSSGLAMSTADVININTTIPPYLLFCSGITIGGFDCNTASGNYINFGNLMSGVTSSADSQIVTATNAGSGYTINVNGPTMTSGNNVINNIPVRDVSRPGTSQFGINLEANTSPSVGAAPIGPGAADPTADYASPNFYKYLPGDTIATASGVVDYRKFTISYILNIPKGQTPGVYVSTLTYVCLANF